VPCASCQQALRDQKYKAECYLAVQMSKDAGKIRRTSETMSVPGKTGQSEPRHVESGPAPAPGIVSMDIKEGLVPGWVADRLSGPTNDAPVDGVRDRVPDR